MAERIPLNVSVQKVGGAIVVTPEGEISYHEAPLFRQFIQQAFDERPRTVVVDMAHVPYMSSPGVAILVLAAQLSRRYANALVICSLTDKVRDILRISRIENIFQIEPNRDAALAR
jgi:anti-anti-sigma factor